MVVLPPPPIIRSRSSKPPAPLASVTDAPPVGAELVEGFASKPIRS
jgi:hypothetical protein